MDTKQALSQMEELQPKIENLDVANRDFLTAYFYSVIDIRLKRSLFGSGMKPVLTDAQKAQVEKLEADAKANGLDKGVEDFINARTKDSPPKTVAEFFAPYRESICLLAGEYFADSFFIYLERVPYLAVNGAMRTSYLYAYIGGAATALRRIHAFYLSGQDLKQYFHEPVSDDARFIANGSVPLLVAEIERGNREMIGFISDTLTGDENGGQVSNDMIEAVMCAGNHELYEQLGKLLLAARLQEGLRTAILNPAAARSPEAFLYLLDIVNKNDLIRFSSVKKAVSLWLGLGAERAKSDRIYTKLLALATEYLSSPEARQKAAQSSDSLELLAGLWAVAFYDAMEMAEIVRGILKSGDRHRMKVVAYYLLNTRLYRLRAEAAKTVLTNYPDDVELCAAFDCFFFRPVWQMNHNDVFKMHFYDYDYPFDYDPNLNNFFADKEEALRFYRIYAGLVEKMGAESITVEASGVFWYSVTMQRQHLLCKMLCILDMTEAEDLTDDYITKYWGMMSPEMRANTVGMLLSEPKTGAQWDTLVAAMGDKARLPREAAFKFLEDLPISQENLLKIEGYLKFKTGDLRQRVLALLKKQTPGKLLETLRRLIASPSREIRQGGLSLAMEIKQDKKLCGIYEATDALVSGLSDATHTEKTLAKQVKAESKAVSKAETVENAFGLADPASRPVLPVPGQDFNLNDAFPLPWDEIPEIYCKLAALIETHADFEYRDRNGHTALVGNHVNALWQSDSLRGVEALPLAGVWRGFYDEHIKDPRVLFQITVLQSMEFLDASRADTFELGLERIFGRRLYEIKQKLAHDKLWKAAPVLNALCGSYIVSWKGWLVTVVKLCGYIWSSLSPEERWREDNRFFSSEKRETSIFAYSYLQFLFNYTMNWKTVEDFKAAFTLRYAVYLESLDHESGIDHYFMMPELARAVNLGLVPFRELILEMTCRKEVASRLSNAFGFLLGRRETRYAESDYEVLQTAVDAVMDKYVDMELLRGDNDTPASPFIPHIKRIPGIPRLAATLRAIGDAPLSRSLPSDYYYRRPTSRIESLSMILIRSCPEDGDTADMLAEALKDAGISEKRLVELAMYNSSWTKLIGEYLGWDGFESGCWYFRAHMNEWFHGMAAVEIEKYTPVSLYDLREGAFDAQWFKKVSETLGEERFAMLYDAAKYTAEGAKHARARKFADAASGRLDAHETQKQVAEKRNKDLLLAYTLIPLKNKDDLLDRYLYLQAFAKESRKFGKQRQESEKTAVRIAMGNLARTAGYSNIMRLTWAMETRTIDRLRPFFEPHKIDGAELYIHIDEDGSPRVVCEKDGAELKSIPAKLKKDETVTEMQKLCKTLADQHKRARSMLENAMTGEELFEVSELQALCDNPVIFPLIKNLVFRRDGALGYFRDGILADAAGGSVPLADGDALVIAHPLHLYKSGNWSAWQQDLFARQIRQPFKQVFRELYLKLPEEMDRFDTLRYEGNQVQQKQAYSLLKARRWSEAGRDSMQKVFYRQETFVMLSISDDWNTPAEIEPPSLHSVEFYAHDKEKRKPISEISELAFSEAMRDIDLVVSVAHAGKVDPQFSHSTIEMRSAIAACTLDTLGVKNVHLEGSHAHIDGKLARYNIHLGSGVIHQKGGSMISVLPVHSQQRGRIFLPFIDDDPKTSEVLSKILLFADDRKIKDPSILSQIH